MSIHQLTDRLAEAEGSQPGPQAWTEHLQGLAAHWAGSVPDGVLSCGWSMMRIVPIKLVLIPHLYLTEDKVTFE